MHSIDEENIVIYVDFPCGLTFYSESSYRSPKDQPSSEKTFQTLWNAQVTINITVLFMRSTPVIPFWPRTVCGTWIQQLLSHSTTLPIGYLYPTNTFKQQLNNLVQIYIRCSPHCERWTKKEEFVRQFCILSETLPTGRPSEGNSWYGCYKNQQILHQQTKGVKQLKQTVRPKNNYSSSQTMELHPLLLAAKDYSTL